MTENAERAATVIIGSDQKNSCRAVFVIKTCRDVVGFVSGGQASNGTESDLRCNRKFSRVICCNLRQCSVVDSGGSRNIEQNSRGIALVQKIERQRGPAVGLTCQNYDQVRSLRGIDY